jgi:putative Mg2+ transporter-C (MgtC) family protein
MAPEPFLRDAGLLLLAWALGGLIGWQREVAGKAAGLRTHMLVSVGAALFILACQQSGMGPEGVSRVIQGLVAGIGFLGAGAILKDEEENRVRGLTTAASIWVTAAVGVCAGMGRESTAVLATGLTLAILALLGRWENRMVKAVTDTPGKRRKG